MKIELNINQPTKDLVYEFYKNNIELFPDSSLQEVTDCILSPFRVLSECLKDVTMIPNSYTLVDFGTFASSRGRVNNVLHKRRSLKKSNAQNDLAISSLENYLKRTLSLRHPSKITNFKNRYEK